MAQAIGIDFGGTTIKSGLVSNGQIVQRGRIIDTQTCANADAIIDALVEVIRELHGGEPTVGHVGIGLPGIIDSVGGVVHELTNVPGWHNVPLRRLLQERSGMMVTIENDANAMAYGEWRYGAAQNGQHVVCVTLGTGVGGALILDGKLYRGAQLGAGEIGHMSIDYRGIPGPYGNFGGLEEYVGNQQIAERAAKSYDAAGQAKNVQECTPADLARAAIAGDPIAKQVWEEIGTEIGAALSSVIWILNPDTIVIGGGIARAGELIFAPIERAVKQRTMKFFNENLRIVPAQLGNDAGIIGSATLALETLPR